MQIQSGHLIGATTTTTTVGGGAPGSAAPSSIPNNFDNSVSFIPQNNKNIQPPQHQTNKPAASIDNNNNKFYIYQPQPNYLGGEI